MTGMVKIFNLQVENGQYSKERHSGSECLSIRFERWFDGMLGAFNPVNRDVDGRWR